jgi:hypothetical protein
MPTQLEQAISSLLTWSAYKKLAMSKGRHQANIYKTS